MQILQSKSGISKQDSVYKHCKVRIDCLSLVMLIKHEIILQRQIELQHPGELTSYSLHVPKKSVSLFTLTYPNTCCKLCFEYKNLTRPQWMFCWLCLSYATVRWKSCCLRETIYSQYLEWCSFCIWLLKGYFVGQSKASTIEPCFGLCLATHLSGLEKANGAC